MSKRWKKNNIEYTVEISRGEDTHTRPYMVHVWEKDTLHNDRFPGGYKCAVVVQVA